MDADRVLHSKDKRAVKTCRLVKKDDLGIFHAFIEDS